jgi:hypothetical protein
VWIAAIADGTPSLQCRRLSASQPHGIIGEHLSGGFPIDATKCQSTDHVLDLGG